MDQGEYTSLAEALEAVPDPRAARGKRYPWPLLLVLISAALASGQPHGRAISQWVREHADTLRSALDWQTAHWPSEATLRRVLRAVDVDALEGCLSQVLLPSVAGHAALVGQAIDGKTVRGTRDSSGKANLHLIWSAPGPAPTASAWGSGKSRGNRTKSRPARNC